MKDQETIQRFIQLRAQGLSFVRIASELNVSKPTLIQWSRTHQFEIQNLRAVETEALAERCLASRESRLNQLGEHLQRVEQELAKRNLESVPTARLLALASKLREEASRENGHIRFSTAVKNIPNEEYFEDVLDWQV
jgi:orotate phosphoribosyltransferase-like protein